MTWNKKRLPLNKTGRKITEAISDFQQYAENAEQFNDREFWLIKVTALKHLKKKIGYGAKNYVYS